MVKHIVMWKFKEEVDEAAKAALIKDMKENLEGLVGKVPGLIKVEFITKPLPSSTHDIALVTELESAAAIEAYAKHPEHVKVANTYVRPYVCERACLDCE